jgi:branched-chain amino acid transport system ATP-binding protein
MGLSSQYVGQAFDIIRTINRQGTTIFMIELNGNIALSIAHWVYVLQTGRVVLSRSAAELRRNPEIREAYLGEKQVMTPAAQAYHETTSIQRN